MPAQSASQRRWAFGVKGPAWAKEHHFDNKGKLPQHVQHGTTNVGLAMFKAMQRQPQKRKGSRG
jgi:hypothetical protein